MTSAPRRWLERRYAGLLVAVLAVALYAPSGCYGRVRYDDYWLWGDASPLRRVTADTLHEIFLQRDGRHALGSEYLPVRDLSVALDMAVWGADEQGPHLTQLLLFAVTVLMLGAMLVRFGVPPAVAWLGVLIWAAHPIHVESVAWLSERKGVLAALLTAATALAWLRYRTGGARGWLAITALTAIAATWSKAPAMFAVPAIAAWDLLLLVPSRRRWIAIAVVGGAVLAAAIPVALVASDTRVIGRAEAGGDRDGRITTATGAVGHYVESLVLVRAPAISYPIDSDGPDVAELALGAAALVGSLVGVVAWWRRRRDRDPAARPIGVALLAWTWIGFVPVSHLVVPVHVVVADRFALVWSLAPCVAAASLLQRIRPPLRLVASAAVVAALGIATIRAEAAWATTLDLFTRAMDTNPRDTTICIALSSELETDGLLPEAAAVLDRGLAASPDEPHLLDALARLLDAHGHGAEALDVASRATTSDAASAFDTYARLLVRANRAAEALPFAERAVARHPELGAYQRTLAVTLVNVGRPRDAIAPLVAAVVTDPLPDDRQLIDLVSNALAGKPRSRR